MSESLALNRYNITAEKNTVAQDHGVVTARIKIEQADNGEWVRYEDVCDIPDDWQPTAENINELPDPIRLYIHGIETLDPQYYVQHNAALQDQVRQLEAKIERMKHEHKNQD